MLGSLCILVRGEEVKVTNISHKKLAFTWKLIRIKFWILKKLRVQNLQIFCWFFTIVINMFIISGINEWCTFVAIHVAKDIVFQ